MSAFNVFLYLGCLVGGMRDSSIFFGRVMRLGSSMQQKKIGLRLFVFSSFL